MVANGVDPSHWQHSNDERERLIGLGDDLVKRGPKWHAALGAVEPEERSHGARPARLRASGRVLVVLRAALRARWTRHSGMARTARTTERWPASATETIGSTASRSATSTNPSSRSSSSTPRSTWASASCGSPPARRGPSSRPPRPRSRSGPGSPSARAPFVLHVGQRSVADRQRVDGRRPAAVRSSSVAPRSSARRTSWSCTTPRRVSCRCSCSTACSSVIVACAAARSRWVPGGCPTCCAGSITRRAIWSRSEPRLATFERTPTEQACAQLRFTPYPFEDIGRIATRVGPAPVLVLIRLPACRGRARPPRSIRALMGRHARGRRCRRRLLRRQRRRVARRRATGLDRLATQEDR